MSPVTCDTFEMALAGGDPQERAAARVHASTCLRCAETLHLWDEISVAAKSLRRDWPAETLWMRISKGLEGEERQESQEGQARRERHNRWTSRWVPLAAAAIVLIAAASGWWMFGRQPASDPASMQLLSARALRDIERTETEYASAIDRLSAVATPAVDADSSPLGLAHKEKLLLIDLAIAQLREAIAANEFNTHLRQELLAMYRAKRLTLEEILNEPKPGT